MEIFFEREREIEGRVENQVVSVNPLNAELNPICHLLALLGAHHILHVSTVRVKLCRVLTMLYDSQGQSMLPEDDRMIETVTLARNKVCSLRMIV